MRKDNIIYETVIDNSFTAVDIIFDDMIKANRILDIMDTEDRRVTYAITTRTAKCKGVITSWDEPMAELGEALDNPANVLMLERLRKRIYDEKKKEYYWEATKHVVITFRGNVLPKELPIWGAVAALPVRPFVDPVIQCFNCYRFGHWKDKCRKKRACLICGEEYHGICTRDMKCTNCEGKHKSNDKSCEVYKRNVQIKKLIATENITSYEANRRYDITERGKRLIGRNIHREDRVREEADDISEVRGSVCPEWSEVVRRGKKGGRSGQGNADMRSKDLSEEEPNLETDIRRSRSARSTNSEKGNDIEILDKEVRTAISHAGKLIIEEFTEFVKGELKEIIRREVREIRETLQKIKAEVIAELKTEGELLVDDIRRRSREMQVNYDKDFDVRALRLVEKDKRTQQEQQLWI